MTRRQAWHAGFSGGLACVFVGAGLGAASRANVWMTAVWSTVGAFYAFRSWQGWQRSAPRPPHDAEGRAELDEYMVAMDRLLTARLRREGRRP